MTFSDKPTLSTSQKLGCLAYGLAGSAIMVPAFMLSRDAVGYCLYSCDTTDQLALIAFPLSLVIVTLGGIWLVRRMIRDRS